MVPRFDLHDGCRDTLFDFKTLHYGVSTYPRTEERCHAVKVRAMAVHSEYSRKARALDARWYPAAANDDGPIIRKLREYGAVRGLVFGAFAETSPEVDNLARLIADSGASRVHSNGEPASDDMRDRILHHVRRKWGVLAARSNARLLLSRLACVGRGATSAADRRTAQHRHASLAGRPLRLWRDF